MSTIKKYGLYIIGIIIGAFFIYGIIRLTIGNPQEYKDTQKEVKELKKQVDSVSKLQTVLNLKIDSLQKIQQKYNDKISNNNSKITENSKQLSTQNKIDHDKINSVDTYNNDDLDKFIESAKTRYSH